MSRKETTPVWICLECNTVIGTEIDDYIGTCNCTDIYDFALWRVTPIDAEEDESIDAWNNHLDEG